MPAPRPLPAEVLALIFHYLASRDLYRCTLVSHLWRSEAESRLYSNITLDRSLPCFDTLIQAARTRKHFLRQVYCSSNNGREVSEADLLDILLDYRPGDENDISSSFSLARVSVSSAYIDAKTWSSTLLPPADYPFGPNRPSLTHFSYVVGYPSRSRFDSILSSLTSLVSLDLIFSRNSQGASSEGYHVDMDKILTAFPHLKHLGITGGICAYAPPVPAAVGGLEVKEGCDNPDHTETDGASTRPGGRYPLESFTFSSRLMGHNGLDMSLFFRRLGNLKRIVILSHLSLLDDYEMGRPWAFGRAMREFCPKLESIGTGGAVALWLFDLPIVPYDKLPHLPSLSKQRPRPQWGLSAEQVYELMEEDKPTKGRWRCRSQEQEVVDMLEGAGVVPFFPQLKTLVLGRNHSLSGQDLISLGVQAPFLTDLDIQISLDHSEFWEIYDLNTAATIASSNRSSILQTRRHRTRRPFNSRDLMLFLQLCPRLVRFSMTKYNILFEDLLEDHNDNRYSNNSNATIRPWACEGTLESLTIGFDILVEQLEDHRLVWNHLGRFKKLRCLTFLPPISPPKRRRSGLNPSIGYGMEDLPAGGGMAETLEEIRCLSSWWKVDDRRKMVLWFAESFPKLRVLGLMYLRWYNEGEQGEVYARFVEDEEVRKCSIQRIFFESPMDE